jgi:hypothetical protein
MTTRGRASAIVVLVQLLAVAQCFSPTLLGCRTAFSLNAVKDSLDNHLDRRSAILGTVVGLSVFAPSVFAPANAAVSNRIPEWTLEGGVTMPTLALNTVGLSVEETELAVRLAKAEGITHVDFHPDKERDGVARYIAKEGRSGLFLTAKIRKAPPGISPLDAAERTRAQIDDDLKALGVNGVDMLMLRDSPDCAVIQAQWAVLEEALAAGKTRSVGVINFCESALTCVLETAKVKPALNYYM